MLNLPEDSALGRKLTTSWSQGLELAAAQIEVTYEVVRAIMALGGVKKHRMPKPLQIPRPVPPRPHAVTASRSPRRVARSVEEVIAVLHKGHRR